MQETLKKLKERLAEIDDLSHIGALIGWDQSTYMPPGGAEARARQAATLSRIVHTKFIDPEIGNLLDQLESGADGFTPESDDARLIAVTRRDYDKAVKVPPEWAAEFSRQTSRCFQCWQKARPADDFDMVKPLLRKTLDMSREYAEFFPGYEHVMDPLIDERDEGMTVARLKPMFERLRQALVPLVDGITDKPEVDDSLLHRSFPEKTQVDFAVDVVKRYGFDFERGRLDRSAHPFMTRFSVDDVRITTRVEEDFLGQALFSIFHEAGHGLYEQGIPHELEGTPIGSGATSGVHESQSRLWENLVGRSRGFWSHFLPKLAGVFPEQLHDVSLDDFYRAINKVEPSLIRTEADEVTYNLHVIIRFELEMEMLEGKLTVDQLPEAWNERYEAYLGCRPENDRNGALQDIHWFHGPVGGSFQCYTIGNILSAQFLEAAVKAYPQIPERIQSGEFGELLSWLREHVHSLGRKYDGEETVRRATGQPMRLDPYLNYLRGKYGELYGIGLPS